MVFNDVTSRDLTRRSDYPFSHDWFRGKSFDTFGPMGPWFVPRDCLGDPQTLRLTLDVNGERMQDGSAGEMIFSVAEQIAYLSRHHDTQARRPDRPQARPPVSAWVAAFS